MTCNTSELILDQILFCLLINDATQTEPQSFPGQFDLRHVLARLEVANHGTGFAILLVDVSENLVSRNIFLNLIFTHQLQDRCCAGARNHEPLIRNRYGDLASTGHFHEHRHNKPPSIQSSGPKPARAIYFWLMILI